MKITEIKKQSISNNNYLSLKFASVEDMNEIGKELELEFRPVEKRYGIGFKFGEWNMPDYYKM